MVIMTPWTDDDLAARILNAEKNVELLRLPVEAEENDPVGREVGEALCPELGKDNRWLADFKASYITDPQSGQRVWTALYQCSPRTEEGNLVRRDWWRFYDPKDPPLFGTELISVDASFKGEADSDFVSIVAYGIGTQDNSLDRYAAPATINGKKYVWTPYKDIQKVWGNHFPNWYSIANGHQNKGHSFSMLTVLIEQAANGEAIIATLRQEMIILPVTPKGGKISRVNAVSPAIESGHVFLPDPAKAPWVTDYINQWAAFPLAKNDDMVDASSQALHAMIYCSGEPWERRERNGREIDLVKFFDPYTIERSTEWMF